MGENPIIKVRKVMSENSKTKEINIPVYATSGAAGADLYACLEEDLIIRPGERTKIPTGIAMEIPNDFVGLIFARSGLAFKKGLTLSNGVGVIDSDYRGEIMVLVINFGQENIVIQNGDRIAQILFLNISKAVFLEVEELDQTLRGDKGFGSTGIK